MKDENRKMLLDILKEYNETPTSDSKITIALLGSIATSLAVIADCMAERSATNES